MEEYLYENLCQTKERECLKLMRTMRHSHHRTISSISVQPFIETKLRFQTIDRLISIVRLAPIISCFETRGGVSKENKLVNPDAPWCVKLKHRKLLKKLIQKGILKCCCDRKCFDILDELVGTEMLLRVKYLQGHNYVLITSLFENSDCVCFDLTPRYNQPDVDMGLKELQSSNAYFRRLESCIVCNSEATIVCKLCNRLVFCSTQCQSGLKTRHELECSQNSVSSNKKKFFQIKQ